MAGVTSDRTVAGALALRGFAGTFDPCWDEWMDPNLLLISSLAQLIVLSQTVPLPSAATTPQGAIYIVPSDATSNANEVAIFDGGAYTFVEPFTGLLAYNVETGMYVNWDGSAWVPAIPTVDGGNTFPSDLTGLRAQRFVVNAAEDLSLIHI